MYSHLEQPMYFDETMCNFIANLYLGQFDNGFPVLALMQIITHHHIGSRLLLQNILTYAQQHYLIDIILADINDNSTTWIITTGTHSFEQIIDQFIDKHIISSRRLSAEYASYLFASKLYSHCHMLNNLINSLPEYQ
jgi:hypothetical protein